MIFAVVVAGGVGSRMGKTDLPKQFMQLHDKPIFIHSVEEFLKVKPIDTVFIGVSREWMGYAVTMVDKHIDAKLRDKVYIVQAGGSRNITICNVISAIDKKFKLKDDDIILTHDAVRPFVTKRIIMDNILTMKDSDACSTVIPSSDTIFQSKDGQVLSGVCKRDEMFLVQTPQTFKYGAYKLAILKTSKEDFEQASDMCKVLFESDIDVKLVAGEINNFKITYMADLERAIKITEKNTY